MLRTGNKEGPERGGAVVEIIYSRHIQEERREKKTKKKANYQSKPNNVLKKKKQNTKERKEGVQNKCAKGCR